MGDMAPSSADKVTILHNAYADPRVLIIRLVVVGAEGYTHCGSGCAVGRVAGRSAQLGWCAALGGSVCVCAPALVSVVAHDDTGAAGVRRRRRDPSGDCCAAHRQQLRGLSYCITGDS